MNKSSPPQAPSQSRLDWIGLVFMSFAATMIAGSIRCTQTFDFGIIANYASGLGDDEFSLILSLCLFLAIPTFLLLLPFRRRALFRWLAWALYTVLWTYLFSMIGFAH
jgi:hypothetical protein